MNSRFDKWEKRSIRFRIGTVMILYGVGLAILFGSFLFKEISENRDSTGIVATIQNACRQQLVQARVPDSICVAVLAGKRIPKSNLVDLANEEQRAIAETEAVIKSFTDDRKRSRFNQDIGLSAGAVSIVVGLWLSLRSTQ